MFWGLVFAVGVSAAYTVALFMYRLFFHPLAKFPGPKLAAATGWYEGYFDLFVYPGGQFMHELKRLHEEYGPIVRINPDELHINDYTWMNSLYTGPGKVRNKYPPAAHFLGLPKGMAGTTPHELHHIRRSAISNLFSKKTVQEAEHIIHECTEKLLKRVDMQIRQDGFAEMRVGFFALATTIVDDYCVGVGVRLLDEGNEIKAREWYEGMAAMTGNAPLARQWSWITPLALSAPLKLVKFISPELASVVQWHRTLEGQASKVTLSTLEEGHNTEKPGYNTKDGSEPSKLGTQEQHNMFRMIIENPDISHADKLPSRMSQEAGVVIGAGGETTANILKTALFYALSNPSEILLPLRAELRTVVPDSDTRPQFKELEKLPFLTAVIKETMRIIGVLTSRSPLISPHENLVYGDWTIPAGTPVSMTYRDVLHDPKIYEEPEEFKPQRWFTADEEKLKLMNRNFVPFGKGTRMCLGFQMAWAELYITTAYFILREDFVLHESTSRIDVDVVSDCAIAQVSPKSKGMKITSTLLRNSA